MKKLISILLSAITLTACSLDTSSASLDRKKNPKSFEDWCKEKSILPEETRITIELLLKEAKTEDCKKANQKLDKLTFLSFSNFISNDDDKKNRRPESTFIID
ncbi:MAG: hypothetical protein MJK14_25200 [Rivularia sp. ALOHA_DT_140]|nr:hypothetical protein [Rivularia sp. ALOHA_DT_140]